jgi:HAD superfamily hydrolase (TIGR01459 family)
MANSPEPQPISGLSALAGDYRALLCDVWGVVHNGVAAFPDAAVALSRYRAGGGKVLLLTNAPRRKENVVDALDAMGFPHDAYDDVVTSGEAGRELLRGRPGVRVLHVGPERGMSLFENLDIRFADADIAELIVCTGLFDDETEVPEDYDPRFAEWKARGLPMLCVNPDVVVERGARLIWCAGAIANRYAEKGGAVTMVGKPFPEIYRAAMRRLGELAGDGAVDGASVLAIGDGAQTDVRGAVNQGLDVLFIAGGIHAGQFGDRDRPEAAEVARFLGEHRLAARGFLPRLRWEAS